MQLIHVSSDFNASEVNLFLMIREILMAGIPKQIVISFYGNFRKGLVVNCIKLKMTHSHNTYQRFVTPSQPPLTIIASSLVPTAKNKQSTITKMVQKKMNWNRKKIRTAIEQVREWRSNKFLKERKLHFRMECILFCFYFLYIFPAI